MPDIGNNHKKSGRVWLYFIIAALAIAAAWWLLMPAPNQPDQSVAGGRGAMFSMRSGAQGAIPVRTAMAQQRNINYTLRVIGTVTPLNTVTVRSRVDGELETINFIEGEVVAKDSVLATIDPSSYQIQLNQALGQHAQTAAQLNNARQDLNRYQQLFRQSSIARQQLDAQIALVDQLSANLQSNQAAIDNARLQLSYTEIKAPISGRAGLRKVDAGNLISAGSAEGLVVLTQTQAISVVFSVPQSDIPVIHAAMKNNNKLAVNVYDSNNALLLDSGILTAIDNQIDVATGTVKLKAELPNQNESLFPNQFVNVHLNVSAQKLLAVPEAAVQYGSIGAFVYLVDAENKVSVQGIEPGRTDNGYIAINAGLGMNDQVVTEGIDRLREGSTVEIITSE